MVPGVWVGQCGRMGDESRERERETVTGADGWATVFLSTYLPSGLSIYPKVPGLCEI